MSPFTPKNWIDYPGTSTPITAAALEDLETRVTDYAETVGGSGSSEEINVLDYGADPTGVASSSTAFANAHAASAAAGWKPVMVPAGTYLMTAQMNIESPMVGTGSPILNWDTDLGAGAFAIATSADFYATLLGLDIRGPGYTTSDPGVHPAVMDGVSIGNHAGIVECGVAGFDVGVSIVGDHSHNRDCSVWSNYIGYDLSDDANNLGNHQFYRVNFGNNTYCSIQCGATNGLSHSTLIDCEFAGEPYGIIDQGAGIYRTLFLTCSWEFIGNACYRDVPGTGGIRATTFINCSDVIPGDSSNRIVGEDYDKSWECNLLENVNILGGTAFWNSGSAAPVTFNSCTGLWCDGSIGDGIAGTAIDDGACPLVGTVYRPADFRSQYGEYTIYNNASGNLSQGQLVQAGSDADTVEVCTTGIPVGVAIHSRTGAGNVLVACRKVSYTHILTTDSALNAAGLYVKPAGTAGRVVKATDANDGPIVGRTVAAASGGAVEVALLLGE